MAYVFVLITCILVLSKTKLEIWTILRACRFQREPGSSTPNEPRYSLYSNKNLFICMHICIYMYSYVNAFPHIHLHVRMVIQTWSNTSIDIYISMHTNICYTYLHLCPRTFECMRAYLFIDLWKNIYTHVCIYKWLCKYIHE